MEKSSEYGVFIYLLDLTSAIAKNATIDPLSGAAL